MPLEYYTVYHNFSQCMWLFFWVMNVWMFLQFTSVLESPLTLVTLKSIMCVFLFMSSFTVHIVTSVLTVLALHSECRMVRCYVIVQFLVCVTNFEYMQNTSTFLEPSFSLLKKIQLPISVAFSLLVWIYLHGFSSCAQPLLFLFITQHNISVHLFRVFLKLIFHGIMVVIYCIITVFSFFSSISHIWSINSLDNFMHLSTPLAACPIHYVQSLLSVFPP